MRILGYGSPFAGLYRLKQHPLKYSTKNKKQLQLSAHINLPNESLKQGENPSSQTKISFSLILQVFVSLTELNQAHLFSQLSVPRVPSASGRFPRPPDDGVGSRPLWNAAVSKTFLFMACILYDISWYCFVMWGACKMLIARSNK